MRLIFISIALLFLTNTYSQTIRKELLNFKNHPYNAYKNIQPVDWGDFGNRTHFTVLRHLQKDQNNNLSFEHQMKNYCDAHELGDVIWPNSSLLTANNIADFVKAIKDRNAYLYQIWGYVPGNPSGEWHQFTLSDSISNIFENTLGSRWLGMDIGEQDGRYLGCYAHYQTGKMQSRFNYYMRFRGHIGRIERDMNNKVTGLLTMPYGHYMAKEGIYTSLASESAQMHPNGQVVYAMIRGAGKQYGVPWFGNVSYFNRWGYKNYYVKGGKMKGTSLSLMKRLMYSHIMYNCMVAGYEGMWIGHNNKLTPIGELQQEANKFTKTHEVGVMQANVAVLLDFMAGWSNPNYNGNLYKIWGWLPYEKGDYLTHNIYNILYPGYANASFFRDEYGFQSNTPYGDCVDGLLTDVNSDLLNKYDLVIIGNKLRSGKELKDKIDNYVLAGGRVFITGENLKAFEGGLCNVKAGHRYIISKGQELRLKNKSIYEKFTFDAYQLYTDGKPEVLASFKDKDLVIRKKFGKGEMIIAASAYGLPVDNVLEHDVKLVEDKELENPYPMLTHVNKVLSQLLEETRFFSMNEKLNYITNYKAEGKFMLCISNPTWKEQPINLQSCMGKIKSINEIKLSNKEKEYSEYVPESLKNISLGKTNENKIAGGDMVLYEIDVDLDKSQQYVSNEETKCKEKYGLPLGNVESVLKEVYRRPTYHDNHNFISVDASYLLNHTDEYLQFEANELERKHVDIVIDLTNMFNLFPGVRIFNTNQSDYDSSQKMLNEILRKTSLYGSRHIVFGMHRLLEGGMHEKKQYNIISEFLTKFSNKAQEKNIKLSLRLKPHGYGTVSSKKLFEIVNRIDRDNLKIALSLGFLETRDGKYLMEKFSSDNVGIILSSSLTKNDAGQYSHMHGSARLNTINKITLSFLLQKIDVPILIDSNVMSQDEEYNEVKYLRSLNPYNH